MRGRLILIEGLDRAGKSTQCQNVVNHLNASGRPTILMKFPDRETGIGKMINGYLTAGASLSDQSIHLLFSANRWEHADEIKHTLTEGTTIVLDRYVYSGAAFSAAKNIPGMDVEWCVNPDVGLPAPDLTLFLDVSEHVAQERGGYGQEKYEKLEFQRRVRQVFASFPKDNTWIQINADADIDDVKSEILKAVDTVFDQEQALRVFKGLNRND